MKRKRRKYVPGLYAVRVARSKTGRGLFALEKIPRDACILEYTGRKLSAAEREDDKGKYYFWVGRNKMIDGNIKSNTARYINHSCHPNSEAVTKNYRIYIFAIKSIKPGEEITYDYGKDYFKAHIGNEKCACGHHHSTTVSIRTI